MSYLYFIKNVINENNENNVLKLKYYFIEVIPQEHGFMYSNPFLQNIKDEYVFYGYDLNISIPFYTNINDKIENIENRLDKDKYYLCLENNIFGFRKPDKLFVKLIQDIDSNRNIIDKINYDIKNKIITLLQNENILNITN